MSAAPQSFPPADTRRRSRTQSFFLRGLITVLPVVFTAIILVAAYRLLTEYVTGPVNSLIYWGLEHNGLGWKALHVMGVDPYADEFLDPQALPLELQDRLRELGSDNPEFRARLARYREREESFLRDFERLAIHQGRLRRDVTARVPRIVGLVVSILLVLSLGSVAGGYLGRKVIRRTERAMHVIPVVRSVYPYTKQLVDFFLAERKFDFDTVVAIPYPSPGLWSTGFVTSSALKTLRATTGENLVSVFIPSSPMPMTGYTIYVAAERLVPLPFTVDEALRIVVSGGVLIPPQERFGLTASEVMAEAHGRELVK